VPGPPGRSGMRRGQQDLILSAAGEMVAAMNLAETPAGRAAAWTRELPQLLTVCGPLAAICAAALLRAAGHVVSAEEVERELARRPDVVAAEFRVLEAHDLMGQARLAQLPSVSLTGQGGTASFALSDVFKTFTFGLMPTVNIPAFNPGIKARVKTTEAQIKVAEEDYRRAVIAAIEEVENALINLEAHRRQKEELQKQIDQLRVVSTQTEAQLKGGVASQLDVFENERSLLTAQLALLASYQRVLSDTVTLYKALGGGWNPVEVANAGR